MAATVRERTAVLAPVATPGPGRAWDVDPSRLPWLLAGAFFAFYCILSIQRHELMYSRAFDLGIFEQAVRGYAEGRGPIADLKGPGFSLLGDHFSPVTALLAPFYQLFPSAVTLLVAQASLCALSIVPLSRWALRALGEPAAWVVGVCVGASWGIAQAVAFDFHEIAFALPLLAFSLSALGEGRLRAAAGWALPLLTVKEDLGLTVAVIGLLIAWRGAVRLGLLTAAAGLLGTLLELFVLIPAFNPQHTYPYWGKVDAAGTTRIDTLVDTIGGMLTLDRVWTIALLLAPVAFLALRSPLLLVAAPTLLWRFVSDNPAYHGTGYHYNAVVVPVVVAAFVEVLVRRRRRSGDRAVRRPLAISAAVTALLVPPFALTQVLAPPDGDRARAVASARELLAQIPDGSTVAASNLLAPQLTSRTTVSLFGAVDRPATCPQYIAVDNAGLGRWLGDDFPSSRIAQSWLYDQARATGYGQFAADSWVTILRYTGVPEQSYVDQVRYGPPGYLLGGLERASDFVWTCTPAP